MITDVPSRIHFQELPHAISGPPPSLGVSGGVCSERPSHESDARSHNASLQREPSRATTSATNARVCSQRPSHDSDARSHSARLHLEPSRPTPITTNYPPSQSGRELEGGRPRPQSKTTNQTRPNRSHTNNLSSPVTGELEGELEGEFAAGAESSDDERDK